MRSPGEKRRDEAPRLIPPLAETPIPGLLDLLAAVRQEIASRKRRRYTAWHRGRVLAAYRREESLRAAAAAAGVGATWAYRVLEEAGAIARKTPQYPVRLVREAERLYIEERLSCRAVASRLRETYGAAPSQEWVHARMRERGVLRTKSQTNKIQNGRRNGRDYEKDLPARARELAARRWSVRRIARELGVSRNAVKAYIDPVDRCSRAEATVRERWLAEDPGAERRRELRVRVLDLRVRHGLKYREISEMTGLSVPTISAYLRQAGVTRPARPTRPDRHLRLEDVLGRDVDEDGSVSL